MTRRRGARNGRVSEAGQVNAEPLYEPCEGVAKDGRIGLTHSLSAGHGQCAPRVQNFTRCADRTGDPTRTAPARASDFRRGHPRGRSWPSVLAGLAAPPNSPRPAPRSRIWVGRSGRVLARIGRPRRWISLAGKGVGGRWA
jgi:hypothetical protein